MQLSTITIQVFFLRNKLLILSSTDAVFPTSLFVLYDSPSDVLLSSLSIADFVSDAVLIDNYQYFYVHSSIEQYHAIDVAWYIINEMVFFLSLDFDSLSGVNLTQTMIFQMSLPLTLFATSINPKRWYECKYKDKKSD